MGGARSCRARSHTRTHFWKNTRFVDKGWKTRKLMFPQYRQILGWSQIRPILLGGFVAVRTFRNSFEKLEKIGKLL